MLLNCRQCYNLFINQIKNKWIGENKKDCVKVIFEVKMASSSNSQGGGGQAFDSFYQELKAVSILFMISSDCCEWHIWVMSHSLAILFIRHPYFILHDDRQKLRFTTQLLFRFEFNIKRKILISYNTDNKSELLTSSWATKFGGGYFINFFFCPNAQVLLENACFRFEPTCANLWRGQNGHFWAKNGVFELFGALEHLKRGHRWPIMLASKLSIYL